MRPISFLLALLLSLTTYAANLAAPFSGSRLNGLTRSSTIFESDSTVDASGNLVDKSGSNYALYSETFSSWTPNVATTVTDNAYRNPVNNNQ
jgi:hypothetical protein